MTQFASPVTSGETPHTPFLVHANGSGLSSSLREVDYQQDIDQTHSVNDIIECSADFTTALRDVAVTKIGEFTVSDTDAAMVFKESRMLTRGSDTLKDLNWEENWRGEIKKIRKRKCQILPPPMIWSEEITVGAYAVNIERVAERKGGALLSMSLEKTAAGSTSRDLWEFPVVRALINYHWRTWAHAVLVIQLAIFAVWTGLLVFYLVLYIGCRPHSPPDEHEEDDDDDSLCIPPGSFMLSLFAFLIMWPFAFEEVLTIWKQRLQWIQFRNFVDVAVISFQTLSFICHCFHFGVGKQWYSVLLATHTVLMFGKLQDFGRVLGLGTAFVETFLAVIYEVRYLIFSISLGALSAALCFATLYTGDHGFEVTNGHEEFQTVHKAMVTTCAIMFGQFDVDYVFHADYPWIKSVFFFGFQMFMTVTVLNMLIAAMTQSYSTHAEFRRIRYNIGRAYVIDELEQWSLRPESKFSSYFAFYNSTCLMFSSERFSLPHSSSTKVSLCQLRQEVSEMSENLKIIMTKLKLKSQEGKQDSNSP